MSGAILDRPTQLMADLARERRLSDTASCLAPLLEAVDWRGTSRQFAEALTGRFETMDELDLRNTMANLRYRSWPKRLKKSEVDKRLLPCLFVPDEGAPEVLLSTADGEVYAYHGEIRKLTPFAYPKTQGTAYFFEPDAEDDAVTKASGKRGWFSAVAHRFESFVVQLVILTGLLNVLALAAPLFVMAVYDQVIATGDRETLLYLAFGVSLALISDAILRIFRGLILSYLGGRIDMISGTAALSKILDLPLARLERASVGVQLARIREFEGMRAFFIGPLAMAFIELPFILIFLVALVAIAGSLALVPLTMMLVLGGAGLYLVRRARASVVGAASGSSDAQALLVELLSHFDAIKADGNEPIWRERYREKASTLALANLKSARLTGVVQAVGHLVMMLAGGTTLVVGAVMAMDGTLTVGALIASMALSWRMLAPLQMVFVALTRLEEARNAVDRINQLMAQPGESRGGGGPRKMAHEYGFKGRITFSRVVQRYFPDHEPALAGVSFEIKPGEVVAIAGANGAGKSTALKLIAGLYRPQAGTITIDGVDMRQLNPVDLRHSIGYLPQQTDLFTGTVADNLRLSRPTASREDLEQACLAAGVWDDVQVLENGLDTVLDDRTLHHLSSGVRRGITLARTFLSEASIMMFDEPGTAIDQESDSRFIETLATLRGRVTTLVATHRPSHIRAADRVIVLDDGAVVFDGTPQEMYDSAARL